jgi:hypothetical protein
MKRQSIFILLICLASTLLVCGCAGLEKSRENQLVVDSKPKDLPEHERAEKRPLADRFTQSRQRAGDLERQMAEHKAAPTEAAGLGQGNDAIGDATGRATTAQLPKTILFNSAQASALNGFDARVRKRLVDPHDDQLHLTVPPKQGHIERIDDDPGIPAGAGGVMDMRTQVAGKQSTCSVAAKGAFAQSGDEHVTTEFEYMFIEDPCDEAELIVHLSSKPEVSQELVEVARIRPPMPGRPGSVGSGSFAAFFGTFSGGSLNFDQGTYIELELRGTSTRCWIDNWDPQVGCIAMCGDYYPDMFNIVNIYDYLVLVAEFGLSNPAAVGKGCLDLVTDGVVNVDDLMGWEVEEVLNGCPLEGSSSASTETVISEALSSMQALETQGAGESEPLLICGKPASGIGLEVPDSNLYRIDVDGICVGDANEAALTGRLAVDDNGAVYQIDGSLGLIRPDTETVVVAPNIIQHGDSLVSVGFNDTEGFLLSDAAFKPDDPNIVYVVPVQVDPLDGNCPYMAAAKLQLTASGNYDLLELYGMDPSKDPEQTSLPSDCNLIGEFVYEPDVQHLHEIEIDSEGNLFVLSAHWQNQNNWVLIYDEAVGNDSEVRVWLSDPNDSAPDVVGPTAMLVSSSEEKLHLASSVAGPNDLTTEVYHFSIDKIGPWVTGLSYDGSTDINCPEPNICSISPSVCDPNLGFVATITSITEDPGDGTLYAIGFTAPKFPAEGVLPYEELGDSIFTTAILAVLPADTNEPVEATEIAGCDLVLPLSIVWTAGQPTYWDANAWDPSPTNGATGVALDTFLTWKPGLWAADTNGHDVYFGTNGWLVNNRDPSTYKGRQDANRYDPPGELDSGRTYYWAVDEVNLAHPNTLWPGQVWVFTTGAVIYVDANAAGANTGSSWTDAFTDLQDALDIAQDGDQIRVAEGTYRPSEPTEPYQPRTATFQLIDGVATYGGFPTGGGNWDGRDPNAYDTILSGDLDGNDIGGQNDPSRAENCYHVVTASGTDATTILDGFTITAGNADGAADPCNRGGGMYVEWGSPTLVGCTFAGNAAPAGTGGGAYIREGGPTLHNCSFVDNSAYNGGGIYIYHSHGSTLIDCNFVDNYAGSLNGGGGGMSKVVGDLSLVNCTFVGNTAENDGGGFFNHGYMDPNETTLLVGCVFLENWAAGIGGAIRTYGSDCLLVECTVSDNVASNGAGMYIWNSSPTLVKCLFSKNSTNSNGAGVYNYFSDTALTNCVFVGNSAGAGGAIYNSSSSPILTNCTLSGNQADWEGGAMHNDGGTSTVTNCAFSGNDAGHNGGGVYSDSNTVAFIDNSVFWGNTDTGDGTEAAQISGLAWVNYSCVEGWTGSLGGTGNIGDDPNLVRDPYDGGDGWGQGNNDDYGDLRLTEGSACIDAAGNNSVPPDTADLDNDGNTSEPTSRDLIGHLRFIDDPNTADTGSGTSPIVDMGAYEFILEIYVDDDAINDPGPGDPDESDPNEDGSSGHPFDSIQEAIDVSVDGDTIVVLPGTYMGTGNHDIDFGGRAITLRSTYPNDPAVVEATVIDCEGSSEDPHRGFRFHSGEDANSVLKGFTIINGYQTQGGALACEASSPTIGNCTFYSNWAQDGGAMSNSNSSPAVSSCTFQENVAVGRGGAIYNPNSSPTLAGCTFVGNSASAGGGVFNQGPAHSPALMSCIFSGNSADNGGGAMFNYRCNSLAANSTFRGNFAGTEGGAIHYFQSNPVLTNCILWANADSGPAGMSAQIDGSGTPTINYCCVQGCTGSLGGVGNIGSDPLLTPDDHLSPGSPCIDSGDPAGDYTGQADIDGESRVMNGRADIGADEFADTDGDGLSDYWELTHFGSLSADPNDDTDGDGLPNIDEFGLYGSNPNAPPIRVPQELATIQAAIDVADQGDTVLVAAGTYVGPGNTDLDFGGKGVVLYGPNGPAITTIDCNDSARGFDFHSGETSATAVVGFTVTNGFADYGGAIRCDHSHPQIRECVFVDNTATNQGHNIYCVMSTPTFADCDISSGASASVADIWMQYGGAHMLGLTHIFDCNWVGTNLTLTGNGIVQMDSGAQLNLDASLVFCDFVGPVNVQVSIGSELTLDGDADVNLADPCDPNVRGTIDCNGLLLVKDNVRISNANINVNRARFEDQTSIVNNVITIDRWAPPGQFVIERDVDVLYNDFHVNGDRYMDLTPWIYQGQFQHCRIFVTITEGVGQDQGGLFECRGDPCFAEPNFADPCCDPNGFTCRVVPGTIPDCNIRTWTVERMEFVEDAKLNLTNRFPFRFPFDPGGDDDVVYVKELILAEHSVLNTAYNWLYYGSLQRAPTAVITDVPLLGFSLICITFNDNLEYIVRVSHNNYRHPIEPGYDRQHVTRIEGNEPDLKGMMQMHAIEDVDQNSPTCGQVISARAKGTFAKASEDKVLITFKYMFIEDPCQEAELIVYLSDEPALDANLVEVARIRAPGSGRRGSVRSPELATFSGNFSRGSLDFDRGTYIALELQGRGARCWIDDWDPSISCTKPKCGDFGQPFGSINIIDFLLLLAEFGLSSPAAVEKGCLDLFTDGCINNDDLLVWDIIDRHSKCPMILGASASGANVEAAPPIATLSQDAGQSTSLLIFGKPGIAGPNTPPETQGSGRLVTDSFGNLYQINSNTGLARTDGSVVAAQDVINDGNNLVTIGFNDGSGLLLSDAAFSPCDPNIVYVVPVLVEPLTEVGCPYMAAAKLELTGDGNYNLLKLYGKNPRAYVTSWPTPCDDFLSFVYEPDLQHLHEIEVDSHGNLFVLSFVINFDVNEPNDNDWLLVYDEQVGNDSEVSFLLSDASVGDSNLKAPSAMALSASEENIYFASSVSSANDLATNVYCFSIDRTDHNVTGLTYDGPLDINCPEPNLCPEFCDEQFGYACFVTSILEDPEDGTLYAAGFTAPKFGAHQPLPSGIETVFTTPMLAVFAPGDPEPVDAIAIDTCDSNLPLRLPLSILWADEVYDGADLTGNGLVNFKDVAFLAQYWRDSCSGPDFCAGADLEPVYTPDGDVDMADLSILARNWLQGRCRD